MPESAFVGVDKIYQNYADVSGKPFFSGDKDEKELEVAQQDSAENAKIDLDEQTGLPVYKAPFGNDVADDEADEGDAAPAPSLTEQVLEILEAKESFEADKTKTVTKAPAKAPTKAADKTADAATESK